MRNAWPTIRCIARVTRNRQHVRAGNVTKSETETTYLISSLEAATPEAILQLNRNHWQIEIMHRDKDVTLGEDRYTNRSDHAPRNIFALTSAAITLLKRISKSPTRAIEMVQDNRGKAIAFIAGDQQNQFLLIALDYPYKVLRLQHWSLRLDPAVSRTVFECRMWAVRSSWVDSSEWMQNTHGGP